MQIHQPVSHGLLYSLTPKSYIARSLSDNSIHDEFDWEEASDYAEESISNSVLTFLKEMDGE